MAEETDIKVYGILKSGTSDKILAYTDNLKDSSLNKTQETINSEFNSKITNLETNTGGATIKILTQEEYNTLEEKDENTIYFIKG